LSVLGLQLGRKNIVVSYWISNQIEAIKNINNKTYNILNKKTIIENEKNR